MEQRQELEPTGIRSIRIYNSGNGAYGFSVRHDGDFRLADYEELELEVKRAKVIRPA